VVAYVYRRGGGFNHRKTQLKLNEMQGMNMKKREIIFILAGMLIILLNFSSLLASAQEKEIPRLTIFSNGQFTRKQKGAVF